MTLVQDSFAQVALTAAPVALFTKTVLSNYQTVIFLNNLQVGDEVLVQIKINDPFGGPTLRDYRTIEIKGAQSDDALVLNWLATDNYQVTVEQPLGAFRNITWVLYTA